LTAFMSLWINLAFKGGGYTRRLKGSSKGKGGANHDTLGVPTPGFDKNINGRRSRRNVLSDTQEEGSDWGRITTTSAQGTAGAKTPKG